MRIGFNPNKDQKLARPDYWHQVVIPVYIPHFEGYFKDAFEIFKKNLESLFATCHAKTFITIVNNGSCEEIINYLQKLYDKKQIHEVLHTFNIGKINAILKGLAGHQFPLITISDADVLFLPNWQKATYEVFEKFPKCGAVCPTPSPRSLRTFTANIYADNLFSNNIKFCPITNKEALKNFAASTGNPEFYNTAQLQNFLCVKNGEFGAVIGAGHFVATYRAEVFQSFKKNSHEYSLGGTSETDFLDKPVIEKGLWRLSTYDNYAYHMGNVFEPWTVKEMEKINGLCSVSKSPEQSVFLHLLSSKPNSLYRWQIKIINRLLHNKKLFKWFLTRKGLTKENAGEYLK